MFEVVFIYLGDGLNPKKDTAVIQSENMCMNVFGCENYNQAEKIATEMVSKGCTAIELCAGFGVEGTARIKRAVEPEVAVGSVRFDFHPALNFKSGDEIF